MDIQHTKDDNGNNDTINTNELSNELFGLAIDGATTSTKIESTQFGVAENNERNDQENGDEEDDGEDEYEDEEDKDDGTVQLPMEIWSIVFMYVRCPPYDYLMEWYERRIEKKDLWRMPIKSMSMVCTDWRDIIQPIQWRAPDLRPFRVKDFESICKMPIRELDTSDFMPTIRRHADKESKRMMELIVGMTDLTALRLHGQIQFGVGITEPSQFESLVNLRSFSIEKYLPSNESSFVKSLLGDWLRSLSSLEELTILPRGILKHIDEKFIGENMANIKKFTMGCLPRPGFCKILAQLGNLQEFTVENRLNSYENEDKLLISELKELQKLMPQCKIVYKVDYEDEQEDYRGDYRDDYDNNYDDDDEDEMLDYTACSSHDCGFCGKCDY